MATYAIGDIHGQYDALMSLLEKINYSDSDVLWLVGDFINRGDKSLEALRFATSLSDSAKIVIGNHDFSLMVHSFGLDAGHIKKTSREILDAPDSSEILEKICSWDLAYFDEERKILLTHAGFYPFWNLEILLRQNQAYRKAMSQDRAEVRDFLKAVYRNGKGHWNEKGDFLEKLCFTVNATTRMRFLNSNNDLDFDCKISPQDAPQGLSTWLEKLPDSLDFKIIFGHWAALGFQSAKNWVCLDGGAAWGGELIAWDIDNWQLAGKAKCKKI